MTITNLIALTMIWTGCTLATYGLVHVFFVTDGPFNLFQWLRMVAGAHSYGSDGKPETFLGKLVGCPYCLGIYVGAVFSLIALPLIVSMGVVIDWGGNSFVIAVLWLFSVYGGQVALESVGK